MDDLVFFHGFLCDNKGGIILYLPGQYVFNTLKHLQVQNTFSSFSIIPCDVVKNDTDEEFEETKKYYWDWKTSL